MQFKTDQDALRYLYSLRRMNIKLGLENISALVDVLDNPHQSYPTIHVAGTNGKGSTCAILESIYRAAGYKTGLYTSPHLVDVCERIRVNGKKIPFSAIKRYLDRLLPVVEKEHCSFFEVLTAIAFAYFRERDVDMGIIEVGMGGRLDATNVVYPEAGVITEIDLDHQKQLGRKPTQIAGEKAGIIKPYMKVIANISRENVCKHVETLTLERCASFVDARKDIKWDIHRVSSRGTVFDLTTPLNSWQGLHLSMLGTHQVENAVTAVRTMEVMGELDYFYRPSAIPRGLATVSWPGRLEIIRRRPTVVVDVAHNPHGIKRTIAEIRRIFPDKRIICVFGVLAGKDYRSMIRSLNEHVERYITITPEDDRALPAADLAHAIRKSGMKVQVGESVLSGYEAAVNSARQGDMVCVLGSHFNLEGIMR